METLAASGLLGSIEMTEINPILDREILTAKLAVELILSGLGEDDSLSGVRPRGVYFNANVRLRAWPVPRPGTRIYLRFSEPSRGHRNRRRHRRAVRGGSHRVSKCETQVCARAAHGFRRKQCRHHLRKTARPAQTRTPALRFANGGPALGGGYLYARATTDCCGRWPCSFGAARSSFSRCRWFAGSATKRRSTSSSSRRKRRTESTASAISLSIRSATPSSPAKATPVLR